MPTLQVGWSDIEGVERLDRALRQLSSQQDMADAARRAVNRTGDMAKTQVIRALTRQTGLKRAVIVRAVTVTRANFDSLNYVMRTTGGDIALKYFSPRETRRGVSAMPFGGRKVFPGTFMKGGRFPNRVTVARFKGHVFERVGEERFPVVLQNSGVVIPAEMVTGATASAFEQSVATNLPRRVEHELKRLVGGVLT